MDSIFYDVKVFGPDGKLDKVITEKKLGGRHWKMFTGSWQNEKEIEHKGGRKESGDVDPDGKALFKKERSPIHEPYYADYKPRQDGLQD